MKLTAGAVALSLVALFVWGRRRLPAGALVALLAAAVGLAVYASGIYSELSDLRAAVEGEGEPLGSEAYAIVGAVAFLETGAPPFGWLFPGEFGVVFGGALAGRGSLEIVPLIALVWLCSAAGDSCCFLLGRRFGREFLTREHRRVRLTHERAEKIDAYFDRWGGATVAVGRLLPLLRPVAPFLAGSSHLSYRRFLPWSILGAGVFSLVFCLIGYASYRSATEAASTLGRIGLVVALVVIVGFVLAVRARRRRGRAETRGAES